MRKEVLNKIITSIQTSRISDVDLYLGNYFEEVLEEYNFNFIHNKVYSRSEDKVYDEDCRAIHLFTIGFNYYFNKHISHSKKALPEQLNDSTNSILLKYVQNPLLVNDILKYLHCYIFGLSQPSTERCVTAGEFLKFEDLIKRHKASVKKSSKHNLYTIL